MPANRSQGSFHSGLIAAALLLIAALHAGHGLPFGWDDQGQYLSHARTLLEGRAYTDIGFIYTTYNNFIGPIAEPPGLPLLIAPALEMSGPALGPVRVVLFVTLVVFVALAWRVARNATSPWTASAMSLLVVAFMAQQHAFDGVLADLPFAAAIWAVLLTADSDAPLSRGRLVTMLIAGALAFTFRMAALALLPAIALLIVLRPARDRPGLGVVAAGWAIVAALVMFMMPTSSVLMSESARSVAEIMADVATNLRTIRFSIQEAFLYPFPWPLANKAFNIVALTLTALGAWQLVRSSPRRFAILFALAYIAMLVVLPTRATRYWWPLVPLQLLAFVEGFRVIRKNIVVPAYIGPAVVALLGLTTIGRSIREPVTPMFERADVRQLVETIRADVPDEPRVSFFSPRTFTWHTGIPAMGHFVADPDQTVAELRDKNVRILVLGPLGASDPHEVSMRRAVAEQSEAFEHLATIGNFELHRVLP